jgi:hypothetical protein
MAEGDATNHHVYTHPGPVEHWRHLVEIVALIIAAAWGFYVFVYQERIKPASELPILDVQPVVMHEVMRGGKKIVSAGLVMKNIGPTELKLGVLRSLKRLSRPPKKGMNHLGVRAQRAIFSRQGGRSEPRMQSSYARRTTTPCN